MRRNNSIIAVLAAACVGAALTATTQAATPKPEDVKKMEAALPAKAPATPKKARKLLVFGNANGFVHSSIELGEETIVKMGEKTGAYTAVINNDPAVFDDLSGYDGILFESTTGHFLIPRSLVPRPPQPKKDATPEEKKAFEAANAEKLKDIKDLRAAEDKKNLEYHDKEQQRFANIVDFVKSGKGVAGIHAASDAYYDYPQWGELIGGYFNGHPFHKVVVKIDDPKSPITAGFEGKEYPIDDETYTFKMVPWNRNKLHVLTSLDVSKFPEDYQKHENRSDHDYGVSWIHEYGKGRVFYVSHGHSEHVYWETPMLEEYLAGIQYALGDLEADATPSNPNTASAKQ